MSTLTDPSNHLLFQHAFAIFYVFFGNYSLITLRIYVHTHNLLKSFPLLFREVFSTWPLFNITRGCKSCDVMSSLCGPMFNLRGEVENTGVIFIFNHGQPYTMLGIYKPILIFCHGRPYIELGIYTHSHFQP